MDRAVIDSLHLFLRNSDVLTNLLIRDIRILDGIEASSNTSMAHNTLMKSAISSLKIKKAKNWDGVA